MKSGGNLGADALADANYAWWSVSTWEQRHLMQAYADSEPHLGITARLDHYCDEAPFVGGDQDSAGLPDWQTSWRHLTADGKAAELTRPSAANQTRDSPPVQPPPASPEAASAKSRNGWPLRPPRQWRWPRARSRAELNTGAAPFSCSPAGCLVTVGTSTGDRLPELVPRAGGVLGPGRFHLGPGRVHVARSRACARACFSAPVSLPGPDCGVTVWPARAPKSVRARRHVLNLRPVYGSVCELATVAGRAGHARRAAAGRPRAGNRGVPVPPVRAGRVAGAGPGRHLRGPGRRTDGRAGRTRDCGGRARVAGRRPAHRRPMRSDAGPGRPRRRPGCSAPSSSASWPRATTARPARRADDRPA